MKELRNSSLPTYEQVRNAFNYDPTVGVLIWRERPEQPKKWNTRFAGKPAGCRNWSGYTQICFNYQFVMAHRLVWIWLYGQWPVNHVDHINGDKNDNRGCNLRAATARQNGYNSGKKRSNTSGFKGVSRCSRTLRWVASIRVNGVKTTVGSFATAEAAGEAYRLAAERFHGEFARTT